MRLTFGIRDLLGAILAAGLMAGWYYTIGAF
jgi:hypothetical protein